MDFYKVKMPSRDAVAAKLRELNRAQGRNMLAMFVVCADGSWFVDEFNDSKAPADAMVQAVRLPGTPHACATLAREAIELMAINYDLL